MFTDSTPALIEEEQFWIYGWQVESDMPMDNLDRLAMLRSHGADHDKNRTALRDIMKSMKFCNYDGVDLAKMALAATESKACAAETSRVGSPLPADDARWGGTSSTRQISKPPGETSGEW